MLLSKKKLKKSLTNYDIEAKLSKSKSFRGIFMHNELPKKIKAEESGVVNLDDSSGNGTHWVAYYNSPRLGYVVYFDSFGLPPSDTIYKYLYTSGKDVYYNSSQIQDITSVKCGYYVVDFIKHMDKGMDPVDYFYKFVQRPSLDNDQLVTDGRAIRH